MMHHRMWESILGSFFVMLNNGRCLAFPWFVLASTAWMHLM